MRSCLNVQCAGLGATGTSDTRFSSEAEVTMGIIVWLLFVLLASSSWGLRLNEEDFQNLLTNIEILTTSNKELQSSYEDLMSRQDILEDRVAKLEELAKVGTLRTCAEYAQYGLTTSGLYMVDPDGPLLGQPPFQVFCDFDAGKD